MKKRAKKITKSDFVWKMGDRPAREIVALAAKRGMRLTERYVYVIRSADKARARRGKNLRSWTNGGEIESPGLKRAGLSLSVAKGGSSTEADLRRAIAEVGLARAREVLRSVEDALA